MAPSPDRPRTVIVGAGPSGLAAAYELVRNGQDALVIDRHHDVGGLARTIWMDGYGFDLGPHRFFTKNPEVLDLWKSVLGGDLLEVDRLTRIYYRNKFFSYPLKPFDALSKLGVLNTTRAVLSYGMQKFRRNDKEPANFEEWVRTQFGDTLYRIFFKSYTEKVWGIPCNEIGVEWAGQRIKGLNLSEAIKNAFARSGSDKVRSLVERFYYPRRGAGQLYDRMADEVRAGGGELRLGAEMVKIEVSDDRVDAIVTADGSRIPVEHAFVSAPITAVVGALDPAAPPDVQEAASALYYRSHITVNLIINRPSPFPDNWIYVHSPELKVARVANYGSFSEEMIAEPGTGALSVEYFSFEGDELWTMSDDDLVELAAKEMHTAGLLDPSDVRKGFVVREADSYPAYYLGHRAQFNVLFEYLTRFKNMTLIGRAGMYRYNNQDHALLTGLYAVKNHLGLADVDLFAINPEDEYLEEIREPEPELR